MCPDGICRNCISSVQKSFFLRYALHVGGIWKGDILVSDFEELEQMDASETNAKTLNAKEVLTPVSGDKFIFPITDGTVKSLEEIRF